MRLLLYFAKKSRRTTEQVIGDPVFDKLLPNQFVTGYATTCKKLHITRAQYRYWYKQLEKADQILTIKTTNKYTIGMLTNKCIFNINAEPITQISPSNKPIKKETLTTINKDIINNEITIKPLVQFTPNNHKALTIDLINDYLNNTAYIQSVSKQLGKSSRQIKFAIEKIKKGFIEDNVNCYDMLDTIKSHLNCKKSNESRNTRKSLN